MIEHVMQAVMNLADHVWVLAQGQLIAAGHARREVTRDDRVIEAYLGHGTAARLRKARAGGRSRMNDRVAGSARPARRLRRAWRCCAASTCRCSAGEIVALLGSNGAGKSTFNKMVCGLVPGLDRQRALRRPGPHARALPRGRQGRPDPGARRPARCSRTSACWRTWSSAPSPGPASAGPPTWRRCSASSRACASASGQIAGTMSGGEQQMLAIGRGLMAEPRAADPGRAVAGPVAAAGGRTVHADPATARRRPGGAAGRAERRPVAGDRGPRLRAGERQHRASPACRRNCSAATNCAGPTSGLSENDSRNTS